MRFAVLLMVWWWSFVSMAVGAPAAAAAGGRAFVLPTPCLRALQQVFSTSRFVFISVSLTVPKVLCPSPS